MTEHNLRDHGLGDSGKPLSRPTAKPLPKEVMDKVIADGGCPNCGCYDLMEITVSMENHLLKGGKGQGKYIGCPACPWASPMMIAADAATKEDNND